MSYADLENALHAWAVASSGFATDHVIWANQNGPRPTTPFVLLTWGPSVAVGIDETTTDTDLDQDPGEEVLMTVSGQRQFTLTVDVFGSSSVGGSSPLAVAQVMQAKLHLPSVVDAFAVVGLACFDCGTLRDISNLVGDSVEPRARLEPRFYYNLQTSERTGYIASVEVTNLTTGGVIDIDSEEGD